MRSEWRTFAILLVGLALLLNPLVPGVHLGSETVYRFDAATVDYADGEGFELRDVSTGRELERLPVDDQILCEDDRYRWFCRAALFVHRNGSVPGYVGAGFDFDADYELVVLDDRLYRPTTVDRGDRSHLALEPVTDSDPLAAVAATDLSRTERKAIESGRVVTYRNVSRRYQLLRHDGEYYVVYRSARKRYTAGRDRCIGTGDGFCHSVDWKRWTDSLLTLASRLAGFALVFTGWERIRR